ncbi:MAG TPA: DUF962 domain-containing protein [Steroidobacteraceae bacterium]
MSRQFASFNEFYAFYLREHSNRTSRRLHVLGTSLGLVILAWGLVSRTWWLLALALVVGYGFAWIGHFFFEHNKPATFRYPLYSLRGDFTLLRDVVTGRIRW